MNYLKTKIDHLNLFRSYLLKPIHVPSNQFTIILIDMIHK